MKEQLNTLLKNIRRFQKTTSVPLQEGLTEEEVLHTLQERASASRIIMDENNKILTEHLFPFLKNPLSADPETTRQIRELESQMYDDECDPGLCLLLSQALFKQAQHQDSIEDIFIYGNHITYSYSLFGRKCMLAPSRELQETVRTYRSRWTEIKTKDAWKGFNSHLYNYCVNAISCWSEGLIQDFDYVLRTVEDVVAFYNLEEVKARFDSEELDNIVREVNSILPCNIWYYSKTFDLKNPAVKHLYHKLCHMCLTSVTAEYQELACLGILPEDPDLESQSPEVLLKAYYAAFCLGFFPEEKMMDINASLYNVMLNSDDMEIRLNGCLFYWGIKASWLASFPPEDLEIQKEKQALMEEFITFLRTIDRIGLYMFSQALKDVNLMVEYLDIHEQGRRVFIEFILQSTSFLHLPTYAHSIMVSKLMLCFAEYFMDKTPELFQGVCHTVSVEDVLERRDEILDEIKLAGLAHDIGKIGYIDTIAVTSRNLTDQEFSIIKSHPMTGYDMVSHKDYGCIPDVIRGHHKSHDGTQGYPADFDNTRSKYHFIISLATAADCIDAATDNIGRCYKRKIMWEKVRQEIIEGAGTRYSPVIATALQDESLCMKVEDILDTERKKTYYDAYIKFSGKITLFSDDYF